MWIFSGAVKHIEGQPEDGDRIEVFSSSGDFVGMGHYQKSSITVRLFSFEKLKPDIDFWTEKIKKAYEFRLGLGLANSAETTMYRIVHGEGDFLPGLVADFYDGTLVTEYHSAGMARESSLITVAFSRVLGKEFRDLVEKRTDGGTGGGKADPRTSAEAKSSGAENPVAEAPRKNVEALENGKRFLIDVEHGQKTGFFLDQRENRSLLSRYAKGRTVLNAFSYTGGFTVYAGTAGALRVISVDSSAKALELLKENVALNPSVGCEYASIQENVFDFLNAPGETFDIIVLDPPAFAKHQSSRQKAIQAYARLNMAAIAGLSSPGLLFTFSCSQVVAPDLFEGAVRSAVINSGRRARVLYRLRQGPDHPVSLTHPEGEYLTGLVLGVS